MGGFTLSDPLKEGIKQLLRVVVVSILPVLIDTLSRGNISWQSILIACTIAALMGIDKWIHEHDKEQGDNNKGLVPF